MTFPYQLHKTTVFQTLVEAEIWSLLSSTYRHGNTDRPTFMWVWIIATVFFIFLLLVRFKKSLSLVLWNAVKRKRVIQQKCSLCATDSSISTDEEVSFRSVTSSPVYADFNRQPKTASGVLIGFLAKFYSFWISKLLLKELRMIQRIILTEIVKRSLNALEREQRGRWPLIACMQMSSANTGGPNSLYKGRV